MNLTVLPMKFFALFFVLMLALAGSGCAWLPKAPLAKPAAAPIVTPDYSLAGKVVSVNTVGRFVVLNFPTTQMPKMDQTLFIYHAGLKVAEVRITGPQQDSNIVADLLSGDAQVGDTARDQ